jgi:hypothetical protein
MRNPYFLALSHWLASDSSSIWATAHSQLTSIPSISFFIRTMAASSESAVTMDRRYPFLAVTM